MPNPKRNRRDDEILLIGRRMSNVFYNLAQRGDGVSNIHLAASEYACFKELQQEWDAAVVKYRNSFRRKEPHA